MNRITEKISEQKKSGKKILSVYFTAGFPKLDDTVAILEALEKSGVDLVEIGMPFSDPLADGPVIQAASTQAIENGMHIEKLFEQLKNIRKTVSVPLVLMGYLNPVLQFGVEDFCRQCSEIGIDGLILPDLPPDQFEKKYKPVFDRYNLANIQLITPDTSEERIRYLDSLSTGFLYLVSSPGVTGNQSGFSEEQRGYFERILAMELKNPALSGFGIFDKSSFEQATEFQDGAIIGSAFIRMLEKDGIAGIPDFIGKIRN